MRHLSRLVPILGTTAIVLSACSGTADLSPSPTATATPPAPSSGAPSSAVAEPSAAPSTGGTTEPIPSDALAPFSCDLPVVEDATAPLANITDVRVGTHAGYDRVVFEFEQGTPEVTLDRASPPFTADASGLPIDVEGASFLRLTMRGGSKQTDAGTSSYDGPTDFSVDHPALVHVVEGGDFERQSTWYLGLTGEACVRVLLLDEPHRLVIDLEHPAP